MALWGDREVIAGANGGTIEVFANGTVSGDGTDFDSITTGNYIHADNQDFRVTDVANTTSLTVVAGITGGAVANVASGSAFSVNEKPIYLSAGSTGNRTTDNANQVFFVDTTEIAVANNEDKGLYGAGWVKWDTYTGSGGTRYKSEVLVAMRRTAAEAGDSEDIVAEDA
jgi:hypothetical protein